MSNVSVKDVLVDICNPETGVKLGERVEQVSVSTPMDDKAEVRTDTADMYSIEIMNSLGMSSVVSNGHYINNTFKSLEGAELLAQNMLNQVELAEEQKRLDELKQTIAVESTSVDNTNTKTE